MDRIKRFLARAPERGASLVEYALLVALIAVVCIGAVTQLGDASSDAHEDAANGLDGGCPAGSHRGDNTYVTGPPGYLAGNEPDTLCWDDVTGRSVGAYQG
jgi:Flp pilus assembly pilin Flp